VLGTGFTLFTTVPVAELLDGHRLRTLAELGVRAVRLTPADQPDTGGADATVRDLAGTHLDQLARAGATALLTRPDFYVFGAAGDAAELARLVDAFAVQLCAPDVSRG